MKARVVPLLAIVALGCAPSKGANDTFVAGEGPIASWVETSDARIKIPLASGLSWGEPVRDQGALLKVRADQGPTYVVVAAIDAPKPLAMASCADAHRAKIAASFLQGGVEATPPLIEDEVRKGVRVPRLHYAVPLQATAGAPPAATFSWWTYLVDGERCVGVGVTTIVHGKKGDPDTPDPDDLQRLDRVYATVADAVVVTR